MSEMKIFGIALATLITFLILLSIYGTRRTAEVLSEKCGTHITASDVFWAGDNLRCAGALN